MACAPSGLATAEKIGSFRSTVRCFFEAAPAPNRAASGACSATPFERGAPCRLFSPSSTLPNSSSRRDAYRSTSGCVEDAGDRQQHDQRAGAGLRRGSRPRAALRARPHPRSRRRRCRALPPRRLPAPPRSSPSTAPASHLLPRPPPRTASAARVCSRMMATAIDASALKIQIGDDARAARRPRSCPRSKSTTVT